MKLFLTSTAANVLNKIVPMLPKKPADTSVAFIPTAGDVYEKTPWIEDDRKKLEEVGFRLKVLDIKDKIWVDFEKALLDVDIVFVAGGNTFYLLEKMRASSFDVWLKENIEKVIYIGSSAGSVMAGPDIKLVEVFDDPSAAQLENTKGLGLVDFVVLPHFGKEKYGSNHQKIMDEYGDQFKIVPITDEQFIVSNGHKYEIL